MTRFFSRFGQSRRKGLARLVSTMGLFFLVLFAVGILRPIRNALALDGLAESEFYKVYFVSAVVILIAPTLTHLSDRIPWRTLIPATAAFFALNLLAFRVFYSEGSGTLGMVFYGWYDLFAAALVTQFFMAVQVFFNVRDAKSAVPIVIAAGSLGATLGSVTTGFLARIIGTPNLILVAALFVGMFAATLPFVWTADSPVRPPGRRVRTGESGGFSTGDFARVFSNRHIRMIAGLVLVTVLVKTLVDYEFNEAVAAYAGDRDAISSFQGYVFGAINWLPIAILLPLGPLIKRWGVGLVVLMLPLVMLGFTAALAVGFSVWMATLAKAADATFRYSAERTGREVLYVPVPTELKLKAKAYVDMAVEKGVGKGVSGLLIFLLLAFVGDYQRIAWAALALSVAWCFMALSAKRRYVTALAESMRGRFANLESGFATLTERSTLAMVEAALRGNTVEIGFGLDLVEQAGSVDATHLADELELLLAHPDEAVRIRVLRLLARFPGLVAEPRIRARLDDSSEPVREAAVGALVATRTDGAGTEALLRELLESTEGAVRLATVSSLLNGTVDRELVRRLGSEHLDARFPGAKSEEGLTATLEGGGSASRRELALTAGLFHRGTFACLIISELLDDDDPVVAGAAIRSAGLVDSAELRGQLISLLAETPLRGSVREALLLADSGTAELCGAKLKDREEKAVIRRHLPSVLGRVGDERSVRTLLGVVADRSDAREIRYQALKALNKLRVRKGQALLIDSQIVLSAAAAEVDDAQRYAALWAALDRVNVLDPERSAVALLRSAVAEAWQDRREATFRLLGLVFPPDEMYRSHAALMRADEGEQANAMEWLEGTLGHRLFHSVLPVLAAPPALEPRGDVANLSAILEELSSEADPWLSSLAAWSGASSGQWHESDRRERLDPIEKVFHLRKVDLLQGARSSHLGLLATIAEEVDVEQGEELLRAGQPNDSLYVIVRGAVELSGVADQRLTLRDGTPFGTWSLIDSDPSVVSAQASEPTRMIRVTRSDFQELLGDHPELATGILQGLARRVRSLVG